MELGKILTRRLAEERITLSREREIDLSKIIQNDQTSEETKERAINELVECNLGLAISIACQMHLKRYLSDGIDLADFVSEGFVGLMEAAKRYEGELAKFSWYASYWIKMKIYRFSENTIRNIRKPVSVINKLKKLKKLKQNSLTEDEICKEMGLSSKHELKILEIAERLHFEDSLDMEYSMGQGAGSYNLHDKLFEGEAKSPADELNDKQVKVILVDCVDCLPEREKFIIQNRFSDEVLTLQEIGERLNITKERVRQLESIALHKLKSHIKKRNLEWTKI
jgi:RNA polymerase sigma factor (sigma-70 family)